jgi:hypothetical protein
VGGGHSAPLVAMAVETVFCWFLNKIKVHISTPASTLKLGYSTRRLFDKLLNFPPLMFRRLSKIAPFENVYKLISIGQVSLFLIQNLK